MFGENWVVGKRYQIFRGRDFIISFWIWPFCGFIRRPEWSWRRMLPFDVDLKTHEETAIFRIKPESKDPSLDEGKPLQLKKSIFQEDLSLVQHSKDIFPIFRGNPPPAFCSSHCLRTKSYSLTPFSFEGGNHLKLSFLVAIPQKPTIFWEFWIFWTFFRREEIQTATTFFEPPRFHQCFFDIQ